MFHKVAVRLNMSVAKKREKILQHEEQRNYRDLTSLRDEVCEWGRDWSMRCYRCGLRAVVGGRGGT